MEGRLEEAGPSVQRAAQPVADLLRHGEHLARRFAVGESDMTAVGWLPECHEGADIASLRQAMRWHKGVVASIEQQGRNADALQMGFGRGPRPSSPRCCESRAGAR